MIGMNESLWRQHLTSHLLATFENIQVFLSVEVHPWFYNQTDGANGLPQGATFVPQACQPHLRCAFQASNKDVLQGNMNPIQHHLLMLQNCQLIDLPVCLFSQNLYWLIDLLISQLYPKPTL